MKPIRIIEELAFAILLACIVWLLILFVLIGVIKFKDLKEFRRFKNK